MHTSLPTWLALSAALIPTTLAFYPYHYGDDSTSTPTSRLRREPLCPNANTEARPVTLPLRRVPTSLRLRQNAYNIVNSNEPKQANSVAIDQDGGDLSYMVAVSFGDGKEKYHLLLDSAASNTWVMGQDCKSDACSTHTAFGPGDSSTLKTDTKSFSVSYGTGSVMGTLATDTLHIGSLSPTLTFGVATNVSNEFRSYPMDGILGIGRGVTTQGSIAAPQVMDVLSANKLIGAKLYGIHLSRNKDGLADGELNLGEVNKARFDGDLSWTDCVPNETGFWEIAISDAGVNGKSVGLNGRTAILDTGTSYILMPANDALLIHSQIPGYKQDAETFSVPCDTTAAVQFSFNKQSYNISTADWRGGKLDSGLCRSNIVGRQTFSETQWLVGDVFLKNVYSVFDFDKKRVGFGVKGTAKQADSRSASPIADSMSSTAVGASRTGGAFSSASHTPSPGGSAAANPTTAAQSQPQGQKDSQGGVAARTSASAIAFLVAFATLSMLIST